jgi:heptosyltransferase-2
MVALLKITSHPALPLMVRLPNWVGDVVMCLPALKHLNALDLPMVVCGRAWAKPLIQNIQYIKFVTLTGSFWHDLGAVRQAVLQDMVGLSFPDSFSSALIFRLAGLRTLGYRDDGRTWLLKWPIEKLLKPTHAVEKWFFLADVAVKTWRQLSYPIKFADLPRSIDMTVQAAQVEKAQLLLAQAQIINKPYILIAPTATGQHRGKLKVWSHFAELTRTLQQQGLTVVACPPQHEQAQALKHSPSATFLQATDLGTFTAIVQAATLVICNDSGVSHIAAALGANQITLFGVTDPKHTGPWSHKALCMGQLGQWPSLEEVLKKVNEQLTTPQPKPKPIKL